jgi:hypothetical protein
LPYSQKPSIAGSLPSKNHRLHRDLTETLQRPYRDLIETLLAGRAIEACCQFPVQWLADPTQSDINPQVYFLELHKAGVNSEVFEIVAVFPILFETLGVFSSS